MTRTFSRTFLRIVLSTCVLAAPAAAQTSASVTLNFNGSGSGHPNSITASGIGNHGPFGEAAVTVTSSGATSRKSPSSLTLSLTSGTLTASGPATAGPDALSGTATVTGGTGEFANASGTFSFNFLCLRNYGSRFSIYTHRLRHHQQRCSSKPPQFNFQVQQWEFPIRWMSDQGLARFRQARNLNWQRARACRLV